MNTTLKSLALLVLSAASLVADPLVYRVPAGSTYTAHLDSRFAAVTLGFLKVPGQGRSFQLDIAARAKDGVLAWEIDRRDGARKRHHAFAGALKESGPLEFDAKQFPSGSSDPEPRGVAMGLVMAFPTLNCGEPRVNATWDSRLPIPVPPNKYTKVEQVDVVAHYRVNAVSAERVVIQVNAEGEGHGATAKDSLKLIYQGRFELDRKSGLPVSASLAGTCARADASSALCKVQFEMEFRGTPLVVPAAANGAQVSLLGVGGM